VCIFSYWIYYAGPGCIVHLPLTTVGVCVDPSGGGQVCVTGNVHVALPTCNANSPRISMHSSRKARVAPGRIVAVHVSSVRIAVWPPMVEGLHVVCGSPF
jgi:hypothetical protein